MDNCKCTDVGLQPRATNALYRQVALRLDMPGGILPEQSKILNGPFQVKATVNATTVMSQTSSVLVTGTDITQPWLQNLRVFGGDYRAWLAIRGWRLRLIPSALTDYDPLEINKLISGAYLEHVPSGSQPYRTYAMGRTLITGQVSASHSTTLDQSFGSIGVNDYSAANCKFIYTRPVNHESDTLNFVVPNATFTGSVICELDAIWVNKSILGGDDWSNLWAQGALVAGPTLALDQGVLRQPAGVDALVAADPRAGDAIGAISGVIDAAASGAPPAAMTQIKQRADLAARKLTPSLYAAVKRTFGQ